MPPKPKGRNLAQQVVQEMITEEEWRRAAQSLWEIATEGSRPDWVYCPSCDRKVQVDRVDLRARSDAMQKLSEMGFGKPQLDEDRQSLIVHRVIVPPKEASNGVHDG